ncbi:MAG: tetratricopeptide repeat protein [Pseudobdellovibrio sp.]
MLLFIITCLLLCKLLKTLEIRNYFLIALIFAVHPMNVAAVSWVFQAKTNLANIFGLISCILFVKYCTNQKIKYYILTFVFITLAYLSKISWVMVPLVFAVYMHIKNFKFKKIIQLSAPFLVASLVFGLINVMWDQNALPVPDSELILNKSVLVRFLLVGQNFLFYLYQTFFPINLMFTHPKIEPDIFSVYSYLPTLALLVVLLVAAYYLYNNNNKLRFYLIGIILSFLFLFPVLGLSEIYFMRFSYVAEHYLTLGLVGFVAPLVTMHGKYRYVKVIAYVFAAALAIQTWSYVADYQDEKILFERNIEKNPNSILPHNILGLLYKNEKNLEMAMHHFDKSIEIHPNAASYYNKASLYEILNQLELARLNYEKAIQLNPYVANSYNNLAIVYLKLKNLPVALDYFLKGIKADPYDVRLYYNMAYAYEEDNQMTQALEWYKKALILQPENPLFKSSVERVLRGQH